jgi:biotin carboxylase
MKRSTSGSVLVLNGSHAEIPLIEAARNLGLRVVTTGTDSLGIGHSYADSYIAADFSDPDAVLAVARQEDVIGVIGACNDFAAITAAQIAQTLELPGHDRPEVAVALHHKNELRLTMSNLGLPSIAFATIKKGDDVDETVGHLRLPVIVKPIDLSGGKGITICSTTKELDRALAFALSQSRASHVLVEEYLDGSHHGFTCFLKSGRVGIWFADDEQYFVNPFLVAGTNSPSSLPSSAISSIIKVVETLAGHLGLVDGLVHLQCILIGADVYVIEVCRRCPGDLYPEFVRHSTGWNYSRAIVLAELGQPLVLPETELHPTHLVRHCLMAEHNGIYERTEIAPSLVPQLVGRWPLAEPGTRVSSFMSQKLEILFFAFPSEREMKAHLARRYNNVRAIVGR